MNILTETFLISILMLLLCLIPLYSESIRRYSKLIYLLGTGALAGILLFDLLPDLFEIGGRSTLFGVAIVWIIYSLAHLIHMKHHKSEADLSHHTHVHAQSNTFFLSSMIGHCVASGMLLVISDGFSGELSRTIFWALLAHKSYESLIVSSVLIKNNFSRKQFISSIFVYSLSMPFGVVLASNYKNTINANTALLITSLAAGTLAGCLVFDFLLPSLSQVRSRWKAATWILVGLGLTQVFMKAI
jgi:zinc transporter ZupT